MHTTTDILTLPLRGQNKSPLWREFESRFDSISIRITFKKSPLYSGSFLFRCGCFGIRIGLRFGSESFDQTLLWAVSSDRWMHQISRYIISVINVFGSAGRMVSYFRRVTSVTSTAVAASRAAFAPFSTLLSFEHCSNKMGSHDIDLLYPILCRSI